MNWNRLVIVSAALVLAAAPPAYAQKVEASVIFGWTLSDGVSGDAFLAPDGEIYDTVDVKDSFNWGFSVGYNITDNAEVGFLYGQQLSKMVLEGTAERELGDLNVTTYHPYFAYNLGEVDAKIRPYFMLGLGATHYGSVDFTRINGDRAETGTETQFSTTWGAGVKYFVGPSVGVRFGVQWTPTYLKSDAAGWWCDPYWGCYLVGDAKYAHQFQFNGGVAFRF